jgi:hypothetical protein
VTFAFTAFIKRYGTGFYALVNCQTSLKFIILLSDAAAEEFRVLLLSLYMAA